MKRVIKPIEITFKGQKLFLNLGDEEVISPIPGGDQTINVNVEYENDVPFLNLYTTNNCNMSCNYCFHQNKYNGINFNPKYDIQSLVDFIKRNNYSNFTMRFFGGEPLMNKAWIYECVNIMSRVGIDCNYTIFTNATLIDDEFLQFARTNKMEFFVSVAGHNESEKGRTYKQIIEENIEKICNLNLRCAGRAVYNPKEIDLVTLVKETLVGKLSMLSITPEWGNRQTDLVLVKDHLEKFSDFYIQNVANKNYRYIGVHPFVSYIQKWMVTKKYDIHQCGAGKSLYSLSIDGKFYPCQCFNENKEFECGSLNTGYNKIFKDLNGDSLETCSKCEIKYFCKYRCFADAYFVNGNIEKMDTFKCEYEKMIVSCSAYILHEIKNNYPDSYKMFKYFLERDARQMIRH